MKQGEERLHHCPVGPTGSVPWLSRDRGHGQGGWEGEQGTSGAADEHKQAGCPCSHHAQPGSDRGRGSSGTAALLTMFAPSGTDSEVWEVPLSGLY